MHRLANDGDWGIIEDGFRCFSIYMGFGVFLGVAKYPLE